MVSAASPPAKAGSSDGPYSNVVSALCDWVGETKLPPAATKVPPVPGKVCCCGYTLDGRVADEGADLCVAVVALAGAG